MKETPQRIWLQTHNDPDISWCDEKIEDTDVAYIRADLVEALNNVADQAFQAIDGAVEDHEATSETIYADDWTGLRDEMEKVGRAVDNALRGHE